MVSPATSLPQSNIEIPESRPAQPERPAPELNVGHIERVASVMLGSLLVANGIKRLNLLGLGIAGAGAFLIQRGATGSCAIYKAANVTANDQTANGVRKALSH